MKLDLLHHTQKKNLKWIKDLNIRPETVKPQMKTQKKLHVTCFGNDFFDIPPKAQAAKAKIDKWHYTKLNCLCTAKEIIDRVKRQPEEWEKIDKRQISKICKELLQLNSKKSIT